MNKMMMPNKTSKWFTIFMAILPLLIMYKVPGTGIRIPTLLTVIALIYSLLQLLNRWLKVSFFMLLPLFLSLGSKLYHVIAWCLVILLEVKFII